MSGLLLYGYNELGLAAGFVFVGLFVTGWDGPADLELTAGYAGAEKTLVLNACPPQHGWYSRFGRLSTSTLLAVIDPTVLVSAMLLDTLDLTGDIRVLFISKPVVLRQGDEWNRGCCGGRY